MAARRAVKRKAKFAFQTATERIDVLERNMKIFQVITLIILAIIFSLLLMTQHTFYKALENNYNNDVEFSKSVNDFAGAVAEKIADVNKKIDDFYTLFEKGNVTIEKYECEVIIEPATTNNTNTVAEVIKKL